jgi:hypothetical protein
MWPDLYKRIKPGGPPHAGNIPEFEIIPTRQFYWGLPIAEATKQNEGKTKLDKDGYLIPETWIAGYPFPKPSGPFKAQQIMFNIEKRYLSWGLDFISWSDAWVYQELRWILMVLRGLHKTGRTRRGTVGGLINARIKAIQTIYLSLLPGISPVQRIGRLLLDINKGINS